MVKEQLEVFLTIQCINADLNSSCFTENTQVCVKKWRLAEAEVRPRWWKAESWKIPKQPSWKQQNQIEGDGNKKTMWQAAELPLSCTLTWRQTRANTMRVNTCHRVLFHSYKETEICQVLREIIVVTRYTLRGAPAAKCQRARLINHQSSRSRTTPAKMLYKKHLLRNWLGLMKNL